MKVKEGRNPEIDCLPSCKRCFRLGHYVYFKHPTFFFCEHEFLDQGWSMNCSKLNEFFQFYRVAFSPRAYICSSEVNGHHGSQRHGNNIWHWICIPIESMSKECRKLIPNGSISLSPGLPEFCSIDIINKKVD